MLSQEQQYARTCSNCGARMPAGTVGGYGYCQHGVLCRDCALRGTGRQVVRDGRCWSPGPEISERVI